MFIQHFTNARRLLFIQVYKRMYIVVYSTVNKCMHRIVYSTVNKLNVCILLFIQQYTNARILLYTIRLNTHGFLNIVVRGLGVLMDIHVYSCGIRCCTFCTFI